MKTAIQSKRGPFNKLKSLDVGGMKFNNVNLNKNGKDIQKDPVHVYCRLRPLKNLAELASVRRHSDTIIQLFHPSGLKSETYFTFKYVFAETTNQKELFDEVALPLVKDLLFGKDGLLFTYGITSSGKTYTLTGNSLNPGILPRTLDVIFNTIGDKQGRKYVFKPDGQNYFEIRSSADALIDWQKEKLAQQRQIQFASRTPSRKRNNNNDEYKDWECRQKDDTAIELPEDNKNLFSVFISYVEIYNNYIYDLLDDTVIDQIKLKQPQSKVLREDFRKKVFVLNGVEIEVKSPDEATDLFIKGIKRRRIAHTALNAESSRSHSVFNIKIVQAPKDAGGEVVLDSKFMNVSQLSLVDLAGSERAGRTQTTGDRLREASSINNSLMALRNCIDILRENQKQNQNKIVPYRDNKLTHLFRSYFEGEGQIKMIICVNPSSDDFDETIHVMKFAESTQEVMVKRATNLQYAKFDIASCNLFNINYPSSEYLNPNDEKIFPEWFEALDERIKNKDIKISLFKERAMDFRNALAAIDKDNVVSKQKVISLKNDLHVRETQIKELEKQCMLQQQTIENYSKKINEMENRILDLENDLTKTKRELGQQEIKFCNIEAKYKERYKSQTEEIKKSKSKIENLKNSEEIQNKKETPKSTFAEAREVFVAKTEIKKYPPVSNPRHKRSLSTGSEKWIDHKPLGTIDLGTVFAPKIKNRKSISNLRELPTNDLINASKYALTHHVAMTNGEIETQIYKGDVIPTYAGGAQITFNDVETLKQHSPPLSRKRNIENENIGIDAFDKKLKKRSRV